MKKFLFIATLAALLCSCGNKQAYTITGNVTGLEGTTIFLKNDAGENIGESTIESGKFTFKGIAEEPSLAIISTETEPMLAMLILEPGKIKVEGSMDTEISITGTKANDANSEFMKYQYDVMKRLSEVTSDEQREELIEEVNAKAEEIMNANMDNYFGLFMLNNYVGQWDTAKLEAKLAELAPALQNTKIATTIREQIEAKKRTEIGSKFIDINLADKDDNMIALSSLVGEGKYVLLDFWASWCNPCMAEIPFLVETYNQYKDKGFSIYGVSLDREKAAWTKAMTDHKMDWVNVSLINDPEKTATTEYSIQSIPANFLIGPDGTIIAKNLRGEEVKAKITELLGGEEVK